MVTAVAADNEPNDAGPLEVRPVTPTFNDDAVTAPMFAEPADRLVAVRTPDTLADAAVIADADREPTVAAPPIDNDAAVTAPTDDTAPGYTVPVTEAAPETVSEPLADRPPAFIWAAVTEAAVTAAATLMLAPVTGPAAEKPATPTLMEDAVSAATVAAPKVDRLAATTEPADASTAAAVTGPVDERPDAPTRMLVAVRLFAVRDQTR